MSNQTSTVAYTLFVIGFQDVYLFVGDRLCGIIIITISVGVGNIVQNTATGENFTRVLGKHSQTMQTCKSLLWTPKAFSIIRRVRLWATLNRSFAAVRGFKIGGINQSFSGYAESPRITTLVKGRHPLSNLLCRVLFRNTLASPTDPGQRALT